MLSQEQNVLVTRTGPGTPAGNLLRRYWQPVALAEEFDGPRPLRPVRLLGEDLVAYREPGGGYGLVGRHCPHRGADLCYGRLEDGGLRCAFHGWLFDARGRCLEQPAEPEDSEYHRRIEHTAYPCIERNGIVFAWLGPGEAPAFAGIDALEAPATHTFAFKGLMECNWLQALEVGIDPAHASFLHRFMDEDDAGTYGLQFRDMVDASEIPMTRILREYPRPRIEVEETDFGLRITAVRDLDTEHRHVRVTNQWFPQAIVIPMSQDMTITQWHVPVDDRHCYWYALFTSFGEPVDRERMRAQRLELYDLPDYRPRVGRVNDYGYDPEEQATRTYTGMGPDINVHDQWAVESMGAIQDRSREHLGYSDTAIRAYRRLLLRAIEALGSGAGDVPFSNVAAPGPIAVDAVAPVDEGSGCWRSRDAARRQRCPWLHADAAE